MKLFAVIVTCLWLLAACGGGAELSAKTDSSTGSKAQAGFATPPQPGH